MVAASPMPATSGEVNRTFRNAEVNPASASTPIC
jgi:hypothetical protein